VSPAFKKTKLFAAKYVFWVMLRMGFAEYVEHCWTSSGQFAVKIELKEFNPIIAISCQV
jgi:hypothetical protein